jgi:ADP-ribosylglycohydrolase
MKSAPLTSQRERILGGLWGSLVGDAMGVPVEFQSLRGRSGFFMNGPKPPESADLH